MKPLHALDLPPVWLAGFLLAARAIGWAVPVALPGGTAPGWAAVAAGAALMGLAVVQMVLSRTTFIPRRDPSALVTRGVFALSRNPIYLGDTLVLAGAILLFDALLALPLVPGFMLLIRRRFILPEEARLTRAFGAEFTSYATRTRRWL